MGKKTPKARGKNRRYTTTPQGQSSRVTYDWNEKTAAGNTNAKREKQKKLRALRRATVSRPSKPRRKGVRGADVAKTLIHSCAMLYINLLVVQLFNPAFATMSGLSRLNLTLPFFLDNAANLNCTVMVCNFINKQLKQDWNYDTIRNMVKRWRKEYIENGCSILYMSQNIGTSNRDGRAPNCNAKFCPMAEQFMKIANDNLGGRGSWVLFASEYNKVCKKKKHPELCATRVALWDWAGLLGWCIHRRWIKPILSRGENFANFISNPPIILKNVF